MISFEILVFLILLYLYIYKGALINQITDDQILRVIEIRSLIERIKVDWDKIMNN